MSDVYFLVDSTVESPGVTISTPYRRRSSSPQKKSSIIISDAIDMAYLNESDSLDTHFIIGSGFHSYCYEEPSRINRPEALEKWIFGELKSLELKTIYITLLAGQRHSLITKEMNKVAYNGKMEIDLKPVLEPTRKTIRICPKCSVNDDFEISISLIQRGIRLEQTIGLFLNPMLTPHQLKMVVTKDESYLRSFGNHLCGISPDVPQSELDAYGDSNPKRRFVSCLCWRRSFYLK